MSAVKDPTAIDGLIPFRDGLRRIGIKSPTTGWKKVRAGELPRLIRRGNRNFFLASELLAHIAKLAAECRYEG